MLALGVGATARLPHVTLAHGRVGLLEGIELVPLRVDLSRHLIFEG